MSDGKKLTLANTLTGFRLIGAVVLIFPQPLSVTFFVVYTMCGITDALDGPIARHSKTDGEFGAKLDSIADLVLYGVLILKLLPTLWKMLPKWVWLWVTGIIVVRIFSYGTAAVKFHRFAAMHTWLNKATGLGVFIIAYVMLTPFVTTYAYIICTVATIAGAEELAIHLVSKTYLPNCRSLLNVIGKSED